MVLRKLNIYMQKRKLNPYFKKFNLKWIKNLNLRPKTLNFETTRRKHRRKIPFIGLGINILYII